MAAGCRRTESSGSEDIRDSTLDGSSLGRIVVTALVQRRLQRRRAACLSDISRRRRPFHQDAVQRVDMPCNCSASVPELSLPDDYPLWLPASQAKARTQPRDDLCGKAHPDRFRIGARFRALWALWPLWYGILRRSLGAAFQECSDVGWPHPIHYVTIIVKLGT